jgi:hypothetical protein
MHRTTRTDSRFASAFAALVCAWALARVVLGLGTASRSAASHDTPALVATAASR